MLKKRFYGILILSLLLIISGNMALFSDDIIPILPSLKLTVKQSPLDIYPPIMIYTAQLSFVPSDPNAVPVVSFYNIEGTSTGYLGSAPIDSTGKAVLSKQMKKGTYVAIATIIINGVKIESNKVKYIVP